MTQRTANNPNQQQHHRVKSDTMDALTRQTVALDGGHSPIFQSNCLNDYAEAGGGCDEDEDYERFALATKTRLKLFAAEFLGTFVFVYLGQSALTSFELIGTQNDMLTRKAAIILAYGLAYTFASLLTLNLSGAHLNPAHTFASAAFGQLSWCRALALQCAQYLGSFVAAIFLHATYSDKLSQRHTEGELFGTQSHLRAHGNILSTGKLFASHPPTEVSLTQLTISYTLATSHLILLTLAINHSKVIRITKSLRPFYLGAALSLVLAAFSANGGPVWNPAQDFSPRLYIALFGWGSPAFNLYNYRYWWLCGIVAPHLGALVGFALYQLCGHLRPRDHSGTKNMLIHHYNHPNQFHHNHQHVNLV